MTMKVLAISLATLATKRRFKFVPYGKSFEPNNNDGPTIACDGRVGEEIDLELSHWNGNGTPDQLYADTSTEIAINFAKKREDYQEFNNAWVLNNHFDTDGVLSVWTCLEPDLALQHADLIREGAEAGDFGEWSSDNGVKLDCSIEAMCDDDEGLAYEDAFRELSPLLKDLEETGGEKYEHLWKPGFEEALAGWDELQSGRARLRRGPGKMVILEESPSFGRLPSQALDRGLKAEGLWEGTTRILRVVDGSSASRVKYQYEKIGHGWIQKVVKRHPIPDANSSALVAALSSKMDGSEWSTGGPGSLVAICQGEVSREVFQDEVAAVLCDLDAGSH